MEPGRLKRSDGGTEEKDERCELEVTGEAGKMVTSAGCAVYMSWLYGGGTVGWKGAKGSYSAERIFGVEFGDLEELACGAMVGQWVAVEDWSCGTALQLSAPGAVDISTA